MIKVSPGQCFQTLPNILDAALFAVLVAFLPFFLPQGQDNTPMETTRTGILVDIKVNACSVWHCRYIQYMYSETWLHIYSETAYQSNYGFLFVMQTNRVNQVPLVNSQNKTAVRASLSNVSYFRVKLTISAMVFYKTIEIKSFRLVNTRSLHPHLPQQLWKIRNRRSEEK